MSDGEEPNRYGPKGTALVSVQPPNAARASDASMAQTAPSPQRAPLSDIPPTAPAGVHPLTAIPLNPRPMIPPTMIRDPLTADDEVTRIAQGQGSEPRPPPAPPPPNANANANANNGGTQALPPSAFASKIPAPLHAAVHPPAPPPPFTPPPVPEDAPPITEPGLGGPESVVHSTAPNVSVPRPPPPRAKTSRLSLAIIGVIATIVIGGAATAIALHVSSGDDEADPPIASVPTAKPKPVQADPPPSPVPTAAPTAPTADPRSPRGDQPPDGPPPGPRRRRRPRGAPPPQW